jgi:RNA polymerase sigma-70 factor (ECF subfamily)
VGTVDDAEVDWFRVLFESHWDAVERYARRRADREVAADAAAEVFAIAWRRRADVPSDPLPWLYGVARRVLANQRRSAQRAGRLVDRIGNVLIAEGDQDSWTADPADVVTGSRAFAVAFSRLSEPDREVLTLVTWEGLDARRAARALGCGVGAVTMRLTRARRRLRVLLAEEAS